MPGIRSTFPVACSCELTAEYVVHAECHHFSHTCFLLPVGASTVDGGNHIDIVDVVGRCWCLFAPVVVPVVAVMVNCGVNEII